MGCNRVEEEKEKKETAFHHAPLARLQLLPTAVQLPELKGTGAAERQGKDFLTSEGR